MSNPARIEGVGAQSLPICLLLRIRNPLQTGIGSPKTMGYDFKLADDVFDQAQSP